MKHLMVAATAIILCASNGPSAATAGGLEAQAGLQPVSRIAVARRVVHLGKKAVQLTDTAGDVPGDRMLLLPVSDFRNGSIEGEIAGHPVAGASAGARGFVGIAFRVQDDTSRYDAFYIRPTNGRSNAQLMRNRSTQYISHPEYTWSRLRAESPGEYESYADISPDRFIPFRIEVEGQRARLFLNGGDQPVLIVNDLKSGVDSSGGVALWVGPEAAGYFRNIRVISR